MNVETVKAQLRKLKLSTAAMEFDEVTARHKAAVSLHWISEVLEREIDKRRERSLEKRIDRAVIPEITTLDEFDWQFNPKIDRDKIEELFEAGLCKEQPDSAVSGQTRHREDAYGAGDRAAGA